MRTCTRRTQCWAFGEVRKATEVDDGLWLRVAFARTGGQTYHFHLLPSGLISPTTDNLIGSGVVFNVEAFFKELEELDSKDVPRIHDRIHISSRCHLNFALHAAVDGLSEEERGIGQIGTVSTCRSPCTPLIP